MSETAATTGGGWRDFRFLWAGQSTSLFGDQFLKFVLPVLAVQLLGVSESKAILLTFSLSVPFLIIGLPAGAIVDRLPRRLTMIVCDGTQAVIYTLTAILAFYGALTFPLMMFFMLLAGSAFVFFQIASTSIIPEIFRTGRDMQRGNSRLFLSESVMETLGPMTAGPLVAAFGVVSALVINAVTFIGSLSAFLFIKAGDARPDSESDKKEKGWLYRDIREGLAFVISHPRIEPVVSCGVIYVLFARMIEVSLVLYCLNVLGLSAATAGVVVGIAAVGFPVGNILSPHALNRFGTARTLVFGAVVSIAGLIMIPVSGAAGNVAALLAASFVHGLGEGLFGPTALTLRQSETPVKLLGRMNSVQRFFMWGAIPLGSLLTAFFVSLVGLSGVLWIGGVGTSLCLPMLLRRGIWKELRTPNPQSDPATLSEKNSP